MGPPGVSGICHHGCVSDAVGGSMLDAIGAFVLENSVDLAVRDATTAVIGSGVLLKDLGACKACIKSSS
jgi:hypothetical protein